MARSNSIKPFVVNFSFSFLIGSSSELYIKIYESVVILGQFLPQVAYHMEYDNLIFYTKSCKELTDSEIEKSSELFSGHYGFYGDSAPPQKRGKRIKLGKKYYENLGCKPNYSVSFAFHEYLLVGHAYFLSKETSHGMASWVFLMVFHMAYK